MLRKKFVPYDMRIERKLIRSSLEPSILLRNLRWSNCIRNSITFSGPSHASIVLFNMCLGLNMCANFMVFFNSSGNIRNNKCNLQIMTFTNVCALNFQVNKFRRQNWSFCSLLSTSNELPTILRK